jgi:chromosome segregation ATPase
MGERSAVKEEGVEEEWQALDEKTLEEDALEEEWRALEVESAKVEAEKAALADRSEKMRAEEAELEAKRRATVEDEEVRDVSLHKQSFPLGQVGDVQEELR